MALGADPGGVLQIVMREGLLLALFVPVHLKVGFWAKEKGKSCRRNYQEQDDEARATKLERRGKDPGVAPAFDRENSYLESL
jgi:hypothetical protein